MNDNHLDLRRLLRTFYEEAELAATDGEREQLITKVVKVLQECRFCAFEKEQADMNDCPKDCECGACYRRDRETRWGTKT